MERSHSFIAGEYYHIYCHAVDSLLLFQGERDYERFLALLFAANSMNSIPRLDRSHKLSFIQDIFLGQIDIGKPLIEIICFCLMPTHFHLLLRELQDSNISKYLHKVQTSHSKYINLKYDRRGHVFESRFHSRHINNNDYLLNISVYIHKNSKDLKGWTGREIEYPWSTYQDFVVENRWQHLIKPDIILDQFKNGKDYHHFVEENYATQVTQGHLGSELLKLR
jgi:putative transposase